MLIKVKYCIDVIGFSNSTGWIFRNS